MDHNQITHSKLEELCRPVYVPHARWTEAEWFICRL